jgi:hypothetical protein
LSWCLIRSNRDDLSPAVQGQNRDFPVLDKYQLQRSSPLPEFEFHGHKRNKKKTLGSLNDRLLNDIGSLSREYK